MKHSPGILFITPEHKKRIVKVVLAVLLAGICLPSFAQFPPPAGQPGTTAIYKDSSVFVAWATSCVYHPGYINIADTTVYYQGSNRANYGVAADATGPPDELVISLGDGGTAILGFDKPLKNGPGWDFAVFENGFTDEFLELAFVEVSSDSIHFFRFPNTSLTQDTVQIATFGTLDATKINNLAGKYRVYYGTPFDLDTLKNITGLDINNVRFVKIVDVVGCIQPPYATYDTQGHIVNDPWPTPFNTGGFDLDAVGVIHQVMQGIGEKQAVSVSVFPNPCGDRVTLTMTRTGSASLVIYDALGKSRIVKGSVHSGEILDLSGLPEGIYLAVLHFADGSTGSVKILRK